MSNEQIFETKSDSNFENMLKSLRSEALDNNQTETEKNSVILNNDNGVYVHEELSPLEKAKLEKAKTSGGIVLTNEELKKGEEVLPTKNIIYNDERIENFKKCSKDLDDTLTKRNCVSIIRKPYSYEDYITMVDEIESIEFDKDGKPYFNHKDDNGNDIPLQFCKIREKNDLEFDYSELTDYEKQYMKDHNTFSEEIKSQAGDVLHDNNSNNEETEKKKIVEIIIDKTGLGIDFLFSDDEKRKIEESDVIRVKEIKNLDLSIISTKPSERSFQEIIQTHSFNSNAVTMNFPASGFRAQLTGMTYGEYQDIAVGTENIEFDRHMKMLSVIYNKMINISTGPFKDFEDFLKHLSYTDINLAIYALFIATEDEITYIGMRCGNKDCKKSFDWRYATRSLLRMEECAPEFLRKVKELIEAPASEYDNIQSNAIVNQSKYIQMPDSGMIYELGVASAYEYIYNFIPLLNEETLKNEFGEDVSEAYLENIPLLLVVRSVRISDGNGGYSVGTSYRDILDALYHSSPKEIKLINSYGDKILSNYNIVFSFGDIQCPHCKSITKKLDVTMHELVFQQLSQLMSTEISLENVQGL